MSHSKPPRLSRAQWELLRKCPDANTGQRLRPYGPEVNTARSLAAKGLVYLPEHCCWRTPKGRALIEASDAAASLCQDEIP